VVKVPLEYLKLSSGIYVNEGKNVSMTSACIETSQPLLIYTLVSYSL